MYKIEAAWQTDEGYTAAVLMTGMGHRCGYVGIPSTHPLHGVDYNESTPLLADYYNKVKDQEINIGEDVSVFSLICCGSSEEDRYKPGILLHVHGGITYASKGGLYPVPFSDHLWFYGFDCAHPGDARDLSIVDSAIRKIETDFPRDGVIRSLEYCVEQCNRLSKQLSQV